MLSFPAISADFESVSRPNLFLQLLNSKSKLLKSELLVKHSSASEKFPLESAMSPTLRHFSTEAY
jgi:hypothetical protein